MILILIVGMVLGVPWLMVTKVVPTQGELQARRNELAVLELRAADLEKRDVRLIWDRCGSGKEQALCFRTKSEWNANKGK